MLLLPQQTALVVHSLNLFPKQLAAQPLKQLAQPHLPSKTSLQLDLLLVPWAHVRLLCFSGFQLKVSIVIDQKLRYATFHNLSSPHVSVGKAEFP